jgi:hypothetical protein
VLISDLIAEHAKDCQNLRNRYPSQTKSYFGCMLDKQESLFWIIDKLENFTLDEELVQEWWNSTYIDRKTRRERWMKYIYPWSNGLSMFAWSFLQNPSIHFDTNFEPDNVLSLAFDLELVNSRIFTENYSKEYLESIGLAGITNCTLLHEYWMIKSQEKVCIDWEELSLTIYFINQAINERILESGTY